MSETAEQLKVARAMLSVLDGHIQALRVQGQDQMDAISSEKEFFIYAWEEFDFTGGSSGRPPPMFDKPLKIDNDAAFVADALLFAGLRDFGSGFNVNGLDRFQLIDNFTGRELTEGLKSSKDTINRIPVQILPNQSGLVPYVWYEFTSEVLIPRGGSLTARFEGQVGVDANFRIALRGYKVFGE